MLLAINEPATANAQWPTFKNRPLDVPATTIAPAPLAIEWSSTEELPAEVAKAACDNLAKFLSVGRGPIGLGFFNAASCHLNAQLLGPALEQETPWHLTLTFSASQLSLSLTYLAPSEGAGQALPVASFIMNALPSTPSLLAKDTLLAATLAAAILDGMPAAFCGAGTPVPTKSPVDRALAPLLPKTWTYFRLEYLNQDKLWRTLPADGNKAAACGQNPRGRGASGTLLLQAAEKRQARLSEALSLANASANSFTLQRFVGGAGDLLERATLANVANAYVGVRYGRELINPGDAVLPASNLFGVLAEFRSGVAKGIRIYYDTVPRVPTKTAGEDLFLSWNRATLGWGFGFDPSCPAVLGRCNLELAPKLGAWNVYARLPFAVAQKVEIAEFSAKNLVSVGLEGSAELDRPWTLWRAWAARDSSVRAFNKQLSSSVSSTRFGLDTFVKLPLRDVIGRNTRLALLFFVFQDNLQLSGDIQLQDKTTQTKLDGNAANLGISSTYGGAGVTVAW